MLNTLGKYQLRRELGKGAMGIVYEGFDPLIERAVAIKTVQTALIPHDCLQETLGRFRREAQAAGRLTHPNIVTVYEYGEENGMAFIAMELVQGKELKESTAPAGPQQMVDILKLMQQLLDALDYSHKHSVIHRDIKPANIMLTTSGQIKIADFGIAKLDTSGSELTQLGTIVGTPIYMSPEQMEGQSVDARSDLYSAGVLLYQLLTGNRPFGGNSMTEIMHKVAHLVPPPPSSLNRHITPTLDRIVMQAIAKDPAKRFQSAAAFAHAIAAALPETIAATSTETAATVRLERNVSAALNTPVLEFDLSAVTAGIEQRLAEQRKTETRLPEPAPVTTRFELNLPEASTSFTNGNQPAQTSAPFAAPAGSTPTKQPEDLGSRSSLLKALAQEVASTRQQQNAQNGQSHEGSERLHQTMEQLHNYLKDFVEHLNAMKPPIPRTYRLDARTQFNQLSWQTAKITPQHDKIQGVPRMTGINLAITLHNTEEVKVVRPWNQLEALQRELQMLKLRVLDDNDLNFRLARQETIQAPLYPTLQITLDFSADYERNQIELSSLNLREFGSERFQMPADALTPALLDELGLFLLARSNQLPAAIKRG